MSSLSAAVAGFSVSRNDSQGIIYDLPLGIPDPSQECPFGEDRRIRVRREAAAQSLCFYVAAGCLRRYVGPTFCAELKKLQAFETGFEKMKKQQADHEAEVLPYTQLLSSSSAVNDFKNIDKKHAAGLIVTFERLISNPDAGRDLKAKRDAAGIHFDEATMQKSRKEQVSLLQAFIHQNRFDTFYDHLFEVKYRRRTEIQRLFMNSIGISSSDLAEQVSTLLDPKIAQEIKENQNNLDAVPLKSWSAALQTSVQLLATMHFGLKFSQYWHPRADFNVFLKELKEHGPMCIAGAFGAHLYQNAPTNLVQRIGNRNVYGWEAGAPRVASPTGHCVTVVGAVAGPPRAEGGYIYFLDPFDPSDPQHPELEKVYKISYRNLRENSDYFGVLYSSNRPPAPLGYALYRKQD